MKRLVCVVVIEKPKRFCCGAYLFFFGFGKPLGQGEVAQAKLQVALMKRLAWNLEHPGAKKTPR